MERKYIKRMKGKIYAYNTHYEIMEYDLGDFPSLEWELSLWDDVRHVRNPKFYYDAENRIMYVPRGYDPNKLSNWAKKPIDFMDTCNERKKVTFNIKTPPRNNVQKESIRFLTGKNEYETMYNESQLVLSLPPGEGKTYCTIASLSLLNAKSMVIVNTDTLRQQWKSKFLEYTEVPDKYIHIIDGTKDIDKLMKSHATKLSAVCIYIVTHVTLMNYLKNNGFNALNAVFNKLGIGVKVVDEAHLCYDSILMIDYATNIWKTIYLTATFARSNKEDNDIFQRSFNMIHKLRKEPKEKRKHVIYIPYIFKTRPSAIDLQKVKGRKGFDRHNYIDYELQAGMLLDIIENYITTMVIKKKVEGKIIILSSKKESCDRILEVVKEILPSYASCVNYTGNKQEDLSQFGIICATPKMLGTGADIPGLRIVINTEPTRSIVNTLQIFGRLREYAPDKDTYYIELIDKSFHAVWDMFRVRYKTLEALAKQVFKIDTTVIKFK
jgi:superfamily II DNA or RNA helicase